MLFTIDNLSDKTRRRALPAQLVRKIFLEDWTMKLIALIITLGLWLGISGLRTPVSQTFRNIPLNLRVSNELVVTNQPVAGIDITITGDKSKINQINEGNLLIALDLSEVPAGERVVSITPDTVNLELPAGVKLESVSPSIIAVRLEKVIERDVPVKADTEGAVAENFEVYGATAMPATVRVSGPESAVRPLDSVVTEKIGVEGRQEDFVARQVSLAVVSGKVRLLDTTVVDVYFRIGEKRVEKSFIVPVRTERGERRVPVKLFGPQSLLDKLRVADLKVEIVRSEAGENTVEVTLPAELQERVEVRDKRTAIRF